MKFRAVILVVVLVFLCSMGTHLSSNELTENTDVTKEVQGLRAEVNKLRRQVDYLMIDLRFDESDIDVLRQRVQYAEKSRARVQALFLAGGHGGSGEQVHRCNAELRLAQAHLAFAEKDYDAAIKHLDATVAASKMVQQTLQNKFDSGTVTLEFLIDSQQSVADAQLEKNRIRRKIQFLQTQNL